MYKRQAGGSAQLGDGDGTEAIVQSLTPTVGTIYGATRVSVIGNDFTDGGNYMLTFSSAIFEKTASSVAFQSCTAMDDLPASCGVLVFETPLWGSSFDSLYAALETSVVLKDNGVRVHKSNTTCLLYTSPSPRD